MHHHSASQRLETSLTIRKDRKAKLNAARKKLRISMIDLLSILFNRSRTLYTRGAKIYRNTKYQQSLGKGQYKITKVTVFAVDHEYCVGMRDVFKVSASLILATAIDAFLDEIMENGIDDSCEKEGKKNNYSKISRKLRSYAIKHQVLGEKEHWTLIWDRQKE